jgi:hypothetical protein
LTCLLAFFGCLVHIAGQVSLPMITALYDANNLILMGARLPQIYKNFSDKSTGQLSIITFAANTLGCIARLFTTMQEGGGSAMMRSYALSECLGNPAAASTHALGCRLWGAFPEQHGE